MSCDSIVGEKPYKIYYSKDPEELETAICEAIRDGYVPAGGIAVVVPRSIPIYIQPVIRTKLGTGSLYTSNFLIETDKVLTNLHEGGQLGDEQKAVMNAVSRTIAKAYLNATSQALDDGLNPLDLSVGIYLDVEASDIMVMLWLS